MNRRTGMLLCGLLLLFPLPTRGGEVLTLEDAVSLARSHHPRLLDFRQRTEAQARRVESGKAPFWPEIETTYNYQRRENVFSFFQTKDSSTFAAEVRYNLFRGFSDRNTLGAARSTLDASRFEEKAAEADIVLEAKEAFIELLRTGKNLETAKESVTLLTRQRRDAEAFYKAGLTAKNEFLKVEVELASARQDLLRAERDVTVARKGLERAIGNSLPPDVVLREIGGQEPLSLDEEALRGKMMTDRSEIRFLEAQRAAREYTRKSIRGGYLPSLDLSLSHSRYGETFAFEGLPDPLFDSDTVGKVEATWNLFDGFRKRSDILAEESEIRALTERVRDTRESLSLQLSTAVEEYRVAAGRIALVDTAVEQAEENYRVTENQFRERVATTTDLLDARVFLTRARNDRINARYDLARAAAVLERVVEGPIAASPPGEKETGAR